jgi:UDP-glucose 4-epimerase
MTALEPILVTGACGYIGSHVCLALKDAGVEVIAVDNLATGFRDAIDSSIPFYEIDLGSIEGMNAIFQTHQVQNVIHLAASSIISESIEQPLKYYTNNTGKLISLLEVCARNKIRNFIFSSSAAVYGPTGNESVGETAPLAPTNPYSSSKLQGEKILSDIACQLDMKVAILRYFNVAGADPVLRAGPRTLNATHLVKVVSEVVAGKRAVLEIYGTDYPTKDGTAVRDFIHVSDLASLHVAVLSQICDTKENLTLNCGYGYGYSVNEVIEVAAKISGRRFPTIAKPRRAGDLPSVVANVDLLKKKLNWTPKFASLPQIMKDSISWELSYNPQ